MKRLCSLMLVLALVGAMVVMPVAAADIQILLDGEAIAFPDAQPFADENSRTLVPLRPVAEAMGLEVEWVQETQTAYFSQILPVDERFHYDSNKEDAPGWVYVGLRVSFTLGSNEYYVSSMVIYDDSDGEIVPSQNLVHKMDTTLVAQDGRVFAPVRFLAEEFGKDVAWDGTAGAVNILPYIMPSTTHGFHRDESGFYIYFSGTLNITAINTIQLDLVFEDSVLEDLPFTFMTYSELVATGCFENDNKLSAIDTSLPFFALKCEKNIANEDDLLFVSLNVNLSKTNGATRNHGWWFAL